MHQQDPAEDATAPGSAPPFGSETAEAPTQRSDIDRSRRRRVRRAPALLAGVAALVAIAATAALGYSRDQDLAAAWDGLTTTTSKLASTTETLATTTTTLNDTTVTLAAASEEREGLESQVTELSAQVAAQIDCAERQSSALDELSRISSLQTDNFNRTAEKSTWAKADDAQDKAISAALKAYYEAYRNAFVGSRSAARVEADKGSKAEARIKAEEKTMAAEQKLVDAAAGNIEKALDALEAQLGTLGSTCQVVTR